MGKGMQEFSQSRIYKEIDFSISCEDSLMLLVFSFGKALLEKKTGKTDSMKGFWEWIRS